MFDQGRVVVGRLLNVDWKVKYMIAVSRIITSLLILAIILSGCRHAAPTTTSVIDHKTKSAEEELEASQYSVYDVVINKMYLEDDRIWSRSN